MRDFRVFISYSQHDGREYAERLSELIRSVFSDIRVFWDAQLIAGKHFWSRLHDEVRRCNVFIYLVSDQSTTMPSGCIREFSWASFYEKHVVPCILPTYSGNPTNIVGLPELSELLYIDMRNGIENCTMELAKLYGTLYESIANASPITQFHRKEMMMLHDILEKLSDENHEREYFRNGTKVYELGFELEYDEYPMIEGRVSQAVCEEVIDILHMMDMLQRAWTAFTDVEQKRVQDEANEHADYLINNVGFWANEEFDHLRYMRFLNAQDKFTWLNYASDDGNSHTSNVRHYRAMLQEYSQIKYDDANDFYTAAGRFLLSVDEVIHILRAQNRVMTHPL